MRYCKSLNGSMNIERDHVQFCCATKQQMPMIPWTPGEELPLERINLVRAALIKSLSGDLDQPVPEYVAYGEPGTTEAHPCRGCRQIEEGVPEVPPSPDGQLTNYLHLQAFTYCNAKCVYCNLRLDEGRTPINQGLHLDKSINQAVAQLLEANAIHTSCQIIFSSGEPSLSPDFMGTLSTVIEKGHRVFINTNAIRHSPEIEAALKSGRALVQVSLDSGDREDYRAIKGVDKFDEVSANIQRYASAEAPGSTFWLKYIVFSENNTRAKMDKFIDYCTQHKIKRVSVSANYNEGEDTSSCSDHQAALQAAESVSSFAYLATKLEAAGMYVHKEFSHLTTNEREMAKREYASALLELLPCKPAVPETGIQKILEGLELASMDIDSPCLKEHFTGLLQTIGKTSKGLALFGAGGHAQWIHGLMGELGITPVVALDNHPPAVSRFPFPTIHPDEMASHPIDTILIGSNAYHFSIYLQLTRMLSGSTIRIIDPYLLLPA